MQGEPYPPCMEALFQQLRAPLVDYLAARQHEDTNPGEAIIEVIAILGEHLAVNFAFVDNETQRKDLLISWIAQLPQAVEIARAKKMPGRGLH